MSAELQQAVTALLRQHPPGHPFLLEVASASMHPTLRQGDQILVLAVPPEELLPEDIVVYLREGGQLLVHRLRRTFLHQGTRFFLCKGDNASAYDALVTDQELVGKVVEIRHPSRLARALLAWGRGRDKTARVLTSEPWITRIARLRMRAPGWFRTRLQDLVIRTQHLYLFRSVYQACYRLACRRFLRLSQGYGQVTGTYLRHSFAEDHPVFGASDLDFSLVLNQASDKAFLDDFGPAYWKLRKRWPLIGEVEMGTRDEWRRWRTASVFRSRLAPSWKLLASRDTWDDLATSPRYSPVSLASEMMVRWLFFHWHLFGNDLPWTSRYRAHLCARDLEGLAIGTALFKLCPGGWLYSFPETSWHALRDRCLRESPEEVSRLLRALREEPRETRHQEDSFLQGFRLIHELAHHYEYWLQQENARLAPFPSSPPPSRPDTISGQLLGLLPFSDWNLITGLFPDHDSRFVVLPEEADFPSSPVSAWRGTLPRSLCFLTRRLLRVLPTLFFGGSLPGYAPLGRISSLPEANFDYYQLPRETRRREACNLLAQVAVWYRFWLICGAGSWARSLAASLVPFINEQGAEARQELRPWPEMLPDQAGYLRTLISLAYERRPEGNPRPPLPAEKSILFPEGQNS